MSAATRGGAEGDRLSVELAARIDDNDMAELCEATDASIIESGGFGWVEPQGRTALERHFRGVLLVPERELYLARLDGLVLAAGGSPHMVRLIAFIVVMFVSLWWLLGRKA